MNNTTSAILYTYKYSLDNFGKDILINDISTRGVIKQVGDKDKLITSATINTGDYVTIDNITYLITEFLENFEQDIYNECYIEPTQDIYITENPSTTSGKKYKSLVSYDRLNILYETYTTSIDEIIMATIPTITVTRGQGLIFNHMMFEIQNIDTTKEGLVTLYAKYKNNAEPTHEYNVVYPTIPTSIDEDATVSIDIPTFYTDGDIDNDPIYTVTTTDETVMTATLNTNTNKIDLYGVMGGTASIKIVYNETIFTSDSIEVIGAGYKLTINGMTNNTLKNGTTYNVTLSPKYPEKYEGGAKVKYRFIRADNESDLSTSYVTISDATNSGVTITSNVSLSSFKVILVAYFVNSDLENEEITRSVELTLG